MSVGCRASPDATNIRVFVSSWFRHFLSHTATKFSFPSSKLSLQNLLHIKHLFYITNLNASFTFTYTLILHWTFSLTCNYKVFSLTKLKVTYLSPTLRQHLRAHSPWRTLQPTPLITFPLVYPSSTLLTHLKEVLRFEVSFVSVRASLCYFVSSLVCLSV